MLMFSKIPLNYRNMQEIIKYIIDLKSQDYKYVLVHI